MMVPEDSVFLLVRTSHVQFHFLSRRSFVEVFSCTPFLGKSIPASIPAGAKFPLQCFYFLDTICEAASLKYRVPWFPAGVLVGALEGWNKRRILCVKQASS